VNSNQLFDQFFYFLFAWKPFFLFYVTEGVFLLRLFYFYFLLYFDSCTCILLSNFFLCVLTGKKF
jgi:hypothetical protein